MVNILTNEFGFDKAYELFLEYEKKETKEAQLANDLDQIDMYIQSIDYEEKYKNLDLSEFKISAKNKILTPLGQEILDSLEWKISC